MSAIKAKLRAGQKRALKMLQTGFWYTRSQIGERAVIDQGWLGDFLGAFDPEARAKTEARNKFPSLVTLGYVRFKSIDICGERENLIQITAKGFKALERGEAD